MKTCLVVDDEDINRTVVATIAEQLGLISIKVTNANDALKFVIGGVVDVVLLDWYMPDVDGIQCLQAIRQIDERKEITVLMYSAIADKENTEVAMDAGADGFIYKPATKEKIREEFTKHKILMPRS